MEIITYIWQHYFFIPGFNALIWVYLNYAGYSLGTAVVILTVVLRFLLLPFSIMNERGKLVAAEVSVKVREIKKDHANDPVMQKQLIREMLKKKKIRPWAKAVVLGVQALALLLLYQVFIGGINTQEKLHLLYPSIPRPDFINTVFLGFNVAQPNYLLSVLVGAYLFVSIFV